MNVTSQTLAADLVSVDQIILAGSTTFRDNYETLQSRLQNQSAVPNLTTFTGIVQADSFPALTDIHMQSSAFQILTPLTVLNFTGTLACTGTITCQQILNMTAFEGLAPNQSAGTVGFLFGRNTSNYNAGMLEWDLTNTRLNIRVNHSSTPAQIQASNTAVNFTGTVVDELGNPYAAIKNNTTVTLSIAQGSVSSNLVFPGTNLRLLFITLTQIKYSVSNGQCNLQVGTTSNNFLDVSYAGIMTTIPASNIVWTTSGIPLTGLYPSTTAEHYITFKLTKLESIGGRQTWTIEQYSGSSNYNAFATGVGRIEMSTTQATNLNQFRLSSIVGTTTGYVNVYSA